MKKIRLLPFLFPLLFLNLTGCLPLIIGGAVGALGGYAVSRNTIETETDINYQGLWDSAIRVSSIRGRITQEDRFRGYIESEIESSRVYIRLIRLTKATTRIRVSAKKHHFPNLGLAQDIFVKIMEQAR